MFTHALQGFSVQMSAAEAKKLAADPNVESVMQDHYMTTATSVGAAGVASVPSPVSAPRLTQGPVAWGLDRVDQRGPDPDHKYHYDAKRAGQGVQIWWVTDGVRETHEDLTPRAVLADDLVNDGKDTQTCGDAGTHEAGISAGKFHGLAKAADIFVVRAFDCDDVGTAANVAAAIEFSANNAIKPAVIGLSLAPVCIDADRAPTPCDRDSVNLISAAVKHALVDKGIQVVQGAGDSVHPATGNGSDACTNDSGITTGVLYVGATGAVTQAGQPGQPNRTVDGAWFRSNYGRCVDIWAPGVSVDVPTSAADDSDIEMSAVGISSAFAVGALALLLSDPLFKNATPAELTAELKKRATPDVIIGMHAGDNNRLLFTKPPGGFTIGTALDSSPGADGSPTLTGVDPAGKMKVRFQTRANLAGQKSARAAGLAASSTWGPWITSSSAGWASAASEQNANGKLQLVGVTTTHQLWQRQQLVANSNTWASWSQLDTPSSLGVKAVTLKRLADGRVVMFGSNDDGASFFRVQTAANATTWSAWSPLPFTGSARSITAEANSDGNVEVFASDTDGKVWRTKQVSTDSATWTTPATIPNAPPVYMVAASRHKDGRVDLFTLGEGNVLAHATQTSAGAATYSAFTEPIANTALTSISATINSTDQIDVIGVDTAGAVLESIETASDANTWPAFTQIGTAGTILPAPASD
ncbi:protease inhibitor I9 family protein [Kribbella sp. NBC_00359]